MIGARAQAKNVLDLCSLFNTIDVLEACLAGWHENIVWLLVIREQSTKTLSFDISRVYPKKKGKNVFLHPNNNKPSAWVHDASALSQASTKVVGQNRIQTERIRFVELKFKKKTKFYFNSELDSSDILHLDHHLANISPSMQMGLSAMNTFQSEEATTLCRFSLVHFEHQLALGEHLDQILQIFLIIRLPIEENETRE